MRRPDGEPRYTYHTHLTKASMSALLIDCLKQYLEPEVASRLESDPSVLRDAQLYLHDLLINEQLLSTDSFTSTSANTPQQRTITEEIAELDSSLRQLQVKLAALTNANRDLIIDVGQDLRSVNNKIEIRLEAEVNAILLNLKDLSFKWDASSKIKAAERLMANNSVLFNIDSILDILELPTLCRLCILQGNYQEALEVSMMVKMLVIKFPNLQTFRLIEDKIKLELQVMVRGLIKLLNTNLKQSNILKVFQILNRPDLVQMANGLGSELSGATTEAGIREKTLKVVYLNSRFRFITTEIAALRPLLKFKKMTYLKRYIEVYREHLFNSLSIYYAIFRSGKLENNEEEDKFLTHAYVKSLVQLLIVELQKHLPTSEELLDPELASQRDSVIVQLIYLCKSLDKYGLDFESMLTWELCLSNPPSISQDIWSKNLMKVKKFRS